MIWPRLSLLLYVVSQTEKEKKDDEYLKHCEIKVVVANRPPVYKLGPELSGRWFEIDTFKGQPRTL